jgi:hypothetical protein
VSHDVNEIKREADVEMTVQEKFEWLAQAVGELGMLWRMTVPPPGDPEWVISLGKGKGRVEVVADTLDVVLGLALEELS